MEKPFDRIWEPRGFRNRDGWMLQADKNLSLFLYARPAHGGGRWAFEILFGPGRRIIHKGLCLPGTPKEDAALSAIQEALVILHRDAVARSYAASNLRVLSGVSLAGLDSAYN